MTRLLWRLRLARVLNYGHTTDDHEWDAWVETRWHWIAKYTARSWARQTTGRRHWVVRTKRDHPTRIRVWMVR